MIYIAFFDVAWSAVLWAYSLGISDSLYPNFSTAFSLVATSFALIIGGYIFAALAYMSVSGQLPLKRKDWASLSSRHVAPDRVVAFAKWLFWGSVICVIGNVVTGGMPPILGIVGIKTEFYLTYGKFSGPLQPILTLLFLISPQLPARKWQITTKVYVLTIFTITILRGPMITMLFQAGLIWAFRQNWRSLRMLLNGFLWGALALLGLSTLMAGLYLLRGGTADALMNFFKIKLAYRDWPPGLIFMIMYACNPLSNLLWVMRAGAGGINGASAFATLIPRLIRGSAKVNTSDFPGTIDGVGTYMLPLYFGYGMAAVWIAQVILGVLAFIFSRTQVARRRPLLAALFVEQLVMSTFSDTFFALVSITEYMLILIYYHYCYDYDLSPPRINPG